MVVDIFTIARSMEACLVPLGSPWEGVYTIQHSNCLTVSTHIVENIGLERLGLNLGKIKEKNEPFFLLYIFELEKRKIIRI